MALAALNETVGSGVKVQGDILDPEVKDTYLEELLSMMGDKALEKRGRKGTEVCQAV